MCLVISFVVPDWSSAIGLLIMSKVPRIWITIYVKFPTPRNLYLSEVNMFPFLCREPKLTVSRYCLLWTFPFGFPLKVFKMRLLGKGFHTLIKGVSFSSPTDVGSHTHCDVPFFFFFVVCVCDSCAAEMAVVTCSLSLAYIWMNVFCRRCLVLSLI